ncbi:FapA family protein [Clostridium algoriphilum]|uniref:flagellar assembly protein A n=1 Tax=Clostridium algoriphilum TaxID=198347 RepID=UPI001CF33B59|nr:flagellar assembly protein A [Clostridium algoriphilum]MCB2294267.1 FapA family protein [Clostridium algoriphilum]
MEGKVCTLKFEGTNVQECLKSASVSLCISEEKIKFLVLEEKKGLFKKHAIISTDVVEVLNNEYVLKDEYILKDDISTETLEVEIQNELDGSIEIKQGKIVIKNPCVGGKPAILFTNKNATLTVNDEKVSLSATVYEESIIDVSFREDEAKRYITLRTSSDKMEAYINIKYEPTTTYKLKDCKPKNSALIELEVKEEKMPPKFTELEINKELLNNNIKYGILKMNVMKCAKTYEMRELLIASGKKNIEAINDRLEIKYNIDDHQKNKEYDDEQVIDYKAIGSVQGVEEGRVLAINYMGKNGIDGIDITGKNIVTKIARRVILGIGEGCKIENGNTVVATTKGRPSSRGSTFFVYKTHKITGDVDLKTGNIQFVGDIIISGNVNEGMKVEAGNSILVKNNVAEAEITASGDIVIKGNVIHSGVSAGKEDVVILEYLSNLKSMKIDLSKLIESITQLKEMNLIKRGTSDGELVKILLETKFKKLRKTSIDIAKKILQKQDAEDELLFIIKNKILNVGSSNIKDYIELNDAIILIDNKILVLDMDLTLPVNVMLDYCQDSVIKSSGNVILTGKGEYVSQIVATDSIIFLKDKSLARGGVLKAGKEIKCKIVGGLGGVSTKLIVEKHGQIWADIAYQNTSFIIGDREYVIDVLSKNVHAYIDEAREFIVDKLQL